MKKFILPVFVMLIGAGAAFAGQHAKKNESTLVNRQGYIFNQNTNRCDPVKMCSTDPGPICTVNGLPTGQQVFGTSGPDVEHPLTCEVTLRRIQ
ncbi:hypothetical protein DRF65_16535 [Chryseobacterium pennae]|uniref:Secreted protein n=1 Tax=Chryseobacterium pennae TaxID=2258962 RepID=A0A3D9C759_9FLAO|nr:DUF6520 family protein [Chryseobacterium pennae]REC61321.1 hypothetical protein DRF65_16535 [Chryseobacterium pennae]